MTNLPPNTVKLFGPDFVCTFEVVTATAFGTVITEVTTTDKVPLSIQQDPLAGLLLIREVGGDDVLYAFSLVNFVTLRPVEYRIEDDDPF